VGQQKLLGLALGGGGARGGAHIGLLKVLDREKISVGAIAGTSAGGIVGGLYAAGLKAVEIADLLSSCTSTHVLEPDPTGWSLMSAQPFIDHLRQRIGDVRIEDLPHPFAAVAVDLRESRQVVLTRGPLALAIQATMAVPGLLSPVEWDGALLVDGGVLNNLPVDVTRKLGAQRVLAQDVSMPRDSPLETPSMGILPGPGPRLLDRLMALSGRKRAMLALVRAFDILSAELMEHRLGEFPPDLLLRPELGATPITDIERLPQMITIGEMLAEEKLDDIRLLAGGTR
jgi:NTE family protein